MKLKIELINGQIATIDKEEEATLKRYYDGIAQAITNEVKIIDFSFKSGKITLVVNQISKVFLDYETKQ